MTPKEKAQELVNKFREFADGIDSETDRFSPNIEKKNAKHCALIAVDEILNNNKILFEDVLNDQYWEEIKQEIKLL